MNQIKIGKFISDCRKEKGLTQEQLGEKLGITFKAVSKWENGKGLPDPSIMIELSNILGITVNELLSGGRISAEEYASKADENIVAMATERKAAEKASIITGDIAIALLVFWNILNFFLISDGVEAIKRPEFIIMDTASLIGSIFYIYYMKKNNFKH